MKDFKEINELKVFRDDVFAGILKRTEAGCEFRFAQSFLENNNFSELSLLMPKAIEPIKVSGINLPPFFAGLLPEGLRLKVVIKNLKTSEDDLFSILASIGERVIGDVYVESNWFPEVNLPKLKEINFYDYFQQIISGKDLLKDDSIAGVQEKLSASMISFPLNIAQKNSKYILKLNPKDKPNLVENEHFCMELAQKCGLNVAKTKLVKDKDENYGLLVTRFDRTWNTEKKRFLMHHQEDACQFLNRYPADKYRLSLKEVVQGIEKHVPAAKVAILNVLQLYAFSYLIGNGDLHAKNISLQIRSGTSFAVLSPAYDLICTYVYGDHKMALKLDGRDDNIKRKNLLEFGQRFGVLENATAKMLDKLIHRLTRNLRILEKIPMPPKKRTLIANVIQKRLTDLS